MYMQIKNDYYVYLHVRLDNGQPFYIGKGRKKRLTASKGRSEQWQEIANKYGFDSIILEDNLKQLEAYNLERYWVNRIGRKDLCKGTLVNLTNGGNGGNEDISEITRKKLSNKGKRPMKEEQKRILSDKIKEYWKNITEEEKQERISNIKKSLKEKYKNKEKKIKIKKTKEEISLALSLACKGKKVEEESKKKISTGIKEYWKNLSPEEKELRGLKIKEAKRKLKNNDNK